MSTQTVQSHTATVVIFVLQVLKVIDAHTYRVVPFVTVITANLNGHRSSHSKYWLIMAGSHSHIYTLYELPNFHSHRVCAATSSSARSIQ